MFFITLVFGAALTLELFGSYISIIGLSKNASYILLGLAITLDFAKIIIATVLYKQWRKLHAFLKYTLIPPLLFLIVFTSSGAYAFLLQEFSKTTLGQEQNQSMIASLEQEKNKLEERKKEIDNQVARLPPESVVQRRRLTDLFSQEINHINSRLIELDKEIPELRVKNFAQTTEGGTIGTIAKAYNVEPQTLTKYLVFPLVIVIDPLAIILLTVANFLVEQRKREKKELIKNQTIEQEGSLNIAQGTERVATLEDLKEELNNISAESSQESIVPPRMAGDMGEDNSPAAYREENNMSSAEAAHHTPTTPGAFSYSASGWKVPTAVAPIYAGLVLNKDESLSNKDLTAFAQEQEEKSDSEKGEAAIEERAENVLAQPASSLPVAKEHDRQNVDELKGPLKESEELSIQGAQATPIGALEEEQKTIVSQGGAAPISSPGPRKRFRKFSSRGASPAQEGASLPSVHKEQAQEGLSVPPATFSQPEAPLYEHAEEISSASRHTGETGNIEAALPRNEYVSQAPTGAEDIKKGISQAEKEKGFDTMKMLDEDSVFDILKELE